MDVIETEGVPIKSWAPEIEEGALEQAEHLSELPFVYKWVVVMPDVHRGYGMPIGGVIATEAVVIPHAVGLDIGCGVRTWATGVGREAFAAERSNVLHDIQRSVPMGFRWHKGPQESPTGLFERAPSSAALAAEVDKARRQLGTLGGGNHFIEVQTDPEDRIWVTIHCGSRNVGKQMAEHYDRVAREMAPRIGSSVPQEWGLAYLPLERPEGREYLAVMGFCLDFARENRERIMGRVREVFARRFPDVSSDPDIDVHHNYAAVEEHFGREVVVHRKGAVRAVGTVVIPGSMGSATYVCRGLASPESFESCSHGAGRAMSRRAAVRQIPADRVMRQMRALDIELVKLKKRDVAEESVEAYKDIDAVMSAQSDLVEPVVRLTPVGVLKA
jgi:tRNA-splicing ligase RtcB